MAKDPTIRKDSQFVRYIEHKVRDMIRTHDLCSSDQRIAVAVSGGKDSLTCLSILQRLGYHVEGIHIDPGIGEYTEQNRRNLEAFCQDHTISLSILTFKEELSYSLPEILHLLSSGETTREYSACMVCGILKRYFLNKTTRDKEYDVLATGHNCDDEAQSFMMNVFRNDFNRAQRQGMRPGIVADDCFIPRIKPLYQIREDEVIRYSKIQQFPVLYGSCPCATDAYRKEYKEMLDVFEKRHPSIKYNILTFQERMANRCKQTVSIGPEPVSVERCTRCNEPTTGTVCRACQIIQKIQDYTG